MLSLDLNCDMGESSLLWPYQIQKDLEILDYVSSINIACGSHAGDPETMRTLSQAAHSKGIAIGAHPSFPDRDNFGRERMSLSPAQVKELVASQLAFLENAIRGTGAPLHHVKPHGALYNMAAEDRTIADAICQAVQSWDKNLILYSAFPGVSS